MTQKRVWLSAVSTPLPKTDDGKRVRKVEMIVAGQEGGATKVTNVVTLSR